MVSQVSYCDSDGILGFMQGDIDNEDGIFKVESRREVEEYPILVASSVAQEVRQSVSGGIPVVVSELEDSSEGEEPMFEDDISVTEKETANRVTKMTFTMNRDER